MTGAANQPPGFWHTVLMLLRTARQRAIGRQARQRQLLRQRRQGITTSSSSSTSLSLLLGIGVAVLVHVCAAFGAIYAIKSSARFGADSKAMFGSLFLLAWSVMLVCQGEGPELDPQQRRHPLWEWLFSHPVRPGAVFLAEMLSPIAANPLYLGAPLYPAILYGATYGAQFGLFAAGLIGIPIAVAAACLSKALEIGVMLRFPLRTRGAILGLMGWAGYSLMMLMIISAAAATDLVNATGRSLHLLTMIPWPWLGWFLGERSDASFSFSRGVLTCWSASCVMVALSVHFAAWGAQRGLAGNLGSIQPKPTQHVVTLFGKDPLYRKELLWFRRDPGAMVQAVLLPLTLAGFQLFNARGALHEVGTAWHVFCGGAIIFGTYFLFMLGPRSLASEGAALWIAQTWPRGLESLLKAKARLWSLIASTMVGLVLCYTAFRFPEKLWAIALVGAGWIIFARSMADKAVTLVTVTTSSGEPERVPWGRRWATQLGMMTFSVGVLSQQWTLALAGIVYSVMSAAAMWQNFRARLPYLYDPWSEPLPPAPTLMHAMVAIAALVDVGATLTGLALGFGGSQFATIARPMLFGVVGIVVAACVAAFLGQRGVTLRQVTGWPHPGQASRVGAVAAGIIGGAVLGVLALCYLQALQLLPEIAESMRRMQQLMAQNPGLRLSYAFVAVLIAPFVEEFLFRGLLFRALDREWGGWRAVLGSAAFFAIYHPPLSWLPVSLVGIANALLFKWTGRLEAAMALHLTYNAVLTL